MIQQRSILPQSFQWEAIVSSSGIGRDVQSVTLSIQHFLGPPRRRPPSKVSQDVTNQSPTYLMTGLRSPEISPDVILCD